MILLWSTVASAFKLSLPYVDNLQLPLYANATSVVVLFVILALQRRVHLLLRCTRAGTTVKVGNPIFLAPLGSLAFLQFPVGGSIVPATIVGLGLIVAGNVVPQWPERRREALAAHE